MSTRRQRAAMRGDSQNNSVFKPSKAAHSRLPVNTLCEYVGLFSQTRCRFRLRNSATQLRVPQPAQNKGHPEKTHVAEPHCNKLSSVGTNNKVNLPLPKHQWLGFRGLRFLGFRVQALGWGYPYLVGGSGGFNKLVTHPYKPDNNPNCPFYEPTCLLSPPDLPGSSPTPLTLQVSGSTWGYI